MFRVLPLENRRLPDASFALAGGVLTLDGFGQGDALSAQTIGPNIHEFTLSGGIWDANDLTGHPEFSLDPAHSVLTANLGVTALAGLTVDFTGATNGSLTSGVAGFQTGSLTVANASNVVLSSPQNDVDTIDIDSASVFLTDIDGLTIQDLTADSADISVAGSLTDTATSTIAVNGPAHFAGSSVTLGNGTFNTSQLAFNSSGDVMITEDSGIILTGNNSANNLTLSGTSIQYGSGASLTVSGTSSFSPLASLSANSGGQTDSLISLSGGTIDFFSGGSTVSSVGSATVGGINVTGADNLNDTLTIDLNGFLGNFSGTISFDGGAAGNDSLVIDDGTPSPFSSVTHNLTNSSSGTVTIDENGGGTDFTISYTGLEPVTDNLSAADRVFDFTSSADETITLIDNNDGTLTIDSTQSESVTFAAPTNSLTILLNGGGIDTVNIGALNGAEANFDITVTGSGSDDILSSASLIDVQGNSFAATVGRIQLTGGGLTTTGNGAVSLTANQFVELSNTAISTVDGGITILANSAAGAGNFHGVDVNGTTVTTTGIGDISITGTGGTTAGGATQHGVTVRASAVIQSTATGADAGEIQLSGTGGAGAIGSSGVRLVPSSSVVSVDGDILIVGNGGPGTSGEARGVNLQNGGIISSTGTGVNAATITIIGTGGTNGGATDGNSGVYLSQSGGDNITSVAGDISITGTGGVSTGTANSGVYLDDNASVRFGSGNLSIDSDSTGGNRDLQIRENVTIGTASDSGNITLIANDVNIQSTAVIQSTGSLTVAPKDAARDITFGGFTGLSLALSTDELSTFADGFSQIVIGDAISGTGTVTAQNHTFSDPVHLVGGSVSVSDLSVGTNTLTVTARTQDVNLPGPLNADGTVSVSAARDIVVTGAVNKTAGGDSSATFQADRNISFNSSADIVSTSGAMNIVLNADRDASGGGRIRLGPGTVVDSNNGNIVMGGGADPTATAAVGHSAGVSGVIINEADVISGTGNISIRGQGHDSASGMGVEIIGNSGTRPNITTTTGNINIVGLGGNGTGLNNGIYINNSPANITTTNGNITLTGTGGGTGNDSRGVTIHAGAVVQSTGSGHIEITAVAGTNTVEGFALDNSDLGAAAGTGNTTITATEILVDGTISNF
ncbi:MAG: hypothetical protein KDA89_13070, partial [Planctomycetaceae bacterium]|nr:hypothetical protein [Planctomycetaceae bacterium]